MKKVPVANLRYYLMERTPKLRFWIIEHTVKTTVLPQE
jgi:hypothetical protein